MNERNNHLSRRGLLFAGASALGGCLIPSKPGPEVTHSVYPIGSIPRRATKDQLFIGAATVDLTPPPGSRTWVAGFGPMHRAERTLDAITGRCLYLEKGDQRVAFVIADVIGLLHPTVERIRGLVGNGIEVIVASTHNHSSPDTLGFWGPALLYAVPHRSGINLRYQRIFERRLAASVALAARRARPATLRFAQGELPRGLSRNLRPPFEPDRQLTVLEARDDRETIATFVQFACHVETLGDRSRVLSAGFPHHLRKSLEAKAGGVAIFANGALGGMVTPEVADGADAEERRTRDREIGESAADTAVSLLAGARALQPDPFAVQRSSIDIPVDNGLYEYIARVGLVEGRPNDGVAIRTEVGRFDLGSFAMALIPGEPTPAVGAELRANLLTQQGVEHASVLGLANDELGYILTPDQALNDEFAYEVSMSPSPRARDFVEQALSRLRR